MLEVGITGQRLHQCLGQVRATLIDLRTKVLSSGRGNQAGKSNLGFLQTACTFLKIKNIAHKYTEVIPRGPQF